MKKRIKVDVVSDVVCPWCYIGKRRFEKAVEILGDTLEVEVNYLPFELNPDMPEGGADQKEYLTKKFGSEERYQELTDKVTDVAQTEGLAFNYNLQAISPNTRKAHALIQFAKAHGVQANVVENLFKAYFTSGVDLSKDENLVTLGIESGLKKEDVELLIHDDNAILQIALQEQEMYKLGITGVPFFIVNDKYGISGAQAVETFVSALTDVGAKIPDDVESCDVDKENC